MIKTLLLTVLIIAISIALLSVRVLFKKNGKFGSHDVGEDKHMRERGIHCSMDQDREARRKGKAF